MYGLDGKTMLMLQDSSELLDNCACENCSSKETGGMEEWAKNEGLHERHNTITCDWYHGTWQYMRLLNMVAVPNWYHFYNEALSKVLQKKPDANVLISACADYGMLAKLHEAIREADADPVITIYDICETPLRSCHWYAERHGLKIVTKRGNIIFDDIPEAPFDLITTDEFLSVLKKEYKPMITEKWGKILKPDGVVVTTAMIGEPTTQEKRNRYAERARKVFDVFGGMLFPNHKDGGRGGLIKKFERFAQYHTRHMIVDEIEIEELFKDYKTLDYSVIATPGECVNPTDSFQIVAGLN